MSNEARGLPDAFNGLDRNFFGSSWQFRTPNVSDTTYARPGESPDSSTQGIKLGGRGSVFLRSTLRSIDSPTVSICLASTQIALFLPCSASICDLCKIKVSLFKLSALLKPWSVSSWFAPSPNLRLLDRASMLPRTPPGNFGCYPPSRLLS